MKKKNNNQKLKEKEKKRNINIDLAILPSHNIYIVKLLLFPVQRHYYMTIDSSI